MGVFDSGLGGLTVLHAVHERLPEESTLYLGDTARLPYGPKSPGTVRRYTREAVDFLQARGAKAIVVACNTATARALDAAIEASVVPVLGVIEPGARAAVAVTRSGRIGVLGTRGTIESGAYERALRRLDDVEVVTAACPLFVPLVEEGWTEGEVPRLVAERYLAPVLERGVDTLLLGCTHYPLLKALLAEVAGGDTTLVDSAETTAGALEELLRERGIAARKGTARNDRHFVTDDAGRFAQQAARFLQEETIDLECVSVDSTA